MIGQGYVVEDDLFSVSRRLREIDPRYFVFYSYKRRRYEVHSTGQRGGSLAVVVPYDRLDARTVELVNKTRSENVKKIAEELDRENARLEKKKLDGAVRLAEKETERALSKGGNYEYGR